VQLLYVRCSKVHLSVHSHLHNGIKGLMKLNLDLHISYAFTRKFFILKYAFFWPHLNPKMGFDKFLRSIPYLHAPKINDGSVLEVTQPFDDQKTCPASINLPVPMCRTAYKGKQFHFAVHYIRYLFLTGQFSTVQATVSTRFLRKN
jgi:hypothetical protein